METRHNLRWPLIAVIGLALLIAIGLLLPVSVADLWRWGADLATHPLAIIGVVALMIALMSLGLPGSLCFWIIAPFHAPWFSVCMLLAGSVGGAYGAYQLGRRLGGAWRPGRLGRQVLHLLATRSDLLTQCALRVLPGFPHAFINLAAGVLRLPLRIYLLAAVVGLGIKWAVYSQAVHGMVSASQAEQALDLKTMLPLIILAALMAMGGVARRLWFAAQTQD